MNGKKSRARRSGSEFSKYDSEGRVISSTSVTTEGEIVRHFYQYDSQGRRIQYEKHLIHDDTSKEDLIFREYTRYLDDGSIYKYTIDYENRYLTFSNINTMGRIVYTKTTNTGTGWSSERSYNYSTNTYETKRYPELFLQSYY